MPIAAIYCRVSTEDQQREGSSLDSQRDYCRRKALDMGYSVPDNLIFSEVFTGADTDRPLLTELRRLIRAHAVNAVFCYSTDRLARNPIHIAIIAEECEKRGIELIFVSEPLDKTPEGKLILYVKGYAAEMEREKIRERSMRGKKEKALQGRLSVGGPRLYGYDVIDGRRVINEVEANVIKQVFTWVGEDRYSLYKVITRLNSEDIPSPGGTKWHENAVYRILTHPAYYGVTYAFRYITVRDPSRKNGKNGHKPRDTKDWIEIPGVTPAIVTKELYESAQQQLLQHRHKAPANTKHLYLFSGGRLRCGTCGRSMSGSVRYYKYKDKHVPSYFYRCICKTKHQLYGRCTQPSVSADVEDIVWESLIEFLNHPQELKKCAEARYGQNPTVAEASEYLVRDTIAKLRVEENRYIELYGKGKISETSFETLVEKVRENVKAQERKLSELAARREDAERIQASGDEIEDTARFFSQALKEADILLKLKAMDALEIRVTVRADKSLLVEGSLPVGAAAFPMLAHAERRKTIPFHLVLAGLSIRSSK